MTPLTFLLTLSGLVAMTMAANPFRQDELSEILQDMMEEKMSSEREALMMEAVFQGIADEMDVDAQKKGSLAPCYPTPVENGISEPDKDESGEWTEYISCNDGYDLTNTTFRKCLTGDYYWSGIAPECKRSCGMLDNPSHGDVTMSGHLEGSTAEYECDKSYFLSGTKERECGSDGKWTSKEPDCKRCYHLGKKCSSTSQCCGSCKCKKILFGSRRCVWSFE